MKPRDTKNKPPLQREHGFCYWRIFEVASFSWSGEDLVRLGRSWVAPGRLLGRHGASWALLGRLEVSWGRLGASWRRLGSDSKENQDF